MKPNFLTTGPPSLVDVHAPDLQRPVTLEQAQSSLDTLMQAAVECSGEGNGSEYMRGVDFYRHAVLAKVYQQASNHFFRHHRRLPDPVEFPETVDYYFAIKFFCSLPISPNPGNKLDALAFAPADVSGTIATPYRPWFSNDWRLPNNGTVPPGNYFLKLANGNSMNRSVAWPPTPLNRFMLQLRARRWAKRNFGLHWGEWWYSLSEPRFFLERKIEDGASDLIEFSIFVRDGLPRLFQYRRDTSDGIAFERLFSPDGTPLPGSTGGRKNKQLDKSVQLSPYIDAMIAAASGIGRQLFFARVDFMYLGEQPPFLGEITLCPYNATGNFKPRDFAPVAKRMIFGDCSLADLSKAPAAAFDDTRQGRSIQPACRQE